jgi:teneurin
MMNKSPCSNNGEFDYSMRICKCNKGWTDSDCSRNENCIDKSCKNCKSGWNGLNCEIKSIETCSSKCLLNGICVNNTCICSPGFQGRNCEINSCPNSCSSHGICDKLSNQNNKYQCVCNYGWTGPACDVAIELMCSDDIDNDKDGLMDCMDSECCSQDVCKSSSACNTSPEPKDRLLRKQPPSLLASFFEKMKFLIEDGSVQTFANTNSFSER